MQQITGVHGAGSPGHRPRALVRTEAPTGNRQGAPAHITLSCGPVWNRLAHFAFFLWVMHLLVVASLLSGTPMPGSDRFHLDLEGNLPTFFSSSILLMASVLLALVAVAKKNEGNRFTLHWAV